MVRSNRDYAKLTPHALNMGYREEWLRGIPEGPIERFAGTGNPFSMGGLEEGERVVDIGCGAGIDSLIAAKMVGSNGAVIGVDMTRSMLDEAHAGSIPPGLDPRTAANRGSESAFPGTNSSGLTSRAG